MKKRIYKEENYKMSKWSGGNTRELAIYPEKAEYLDRDFLWRLSSADSDLEESSFTKLPDYDRILMVLEGSVVLAHGEERTASLSAYEYDAFDGAVKTKCFGKLIKDYNLIYRKGCKGRMELVDLTEEAQQVESRFEGSRCLGIYSAEGYTVVSAGGKTDMVKADEQMVIELEPGEALSLSVMGQGKCILTEVAFEKEEVLDWIRMNFLPAKNVLHGHTSYGLKHILQDDTGIYLTNNEFKDAMMLCGYEPSNPNELNWHYRIKKRSPAFSLWRKRYGA